MVRPATAAELRLASTRAARPCQAQNSFHLFRPLYSRAQRPLLFLLASQQPAAQAPAAGGASARLNMLLDLLHFLQRAPGRKNHHLSSSYCLREAKASAPVSAGGAGGLPRLRWPSRLREVVETAVLLPVGGGDPSSSRVRFPAAASRRWRRRRRQGIRSSRAPPRLGDASLRRRRRARGGGVRLRRLLCRSPRGLPLRRLGEAAVPATRFVNQAATVMGFVAGWRVDRVRASFDASRRRASIQGRRGSGCVPGRCFFYGGFNPAAVSGVYCGSLQSLLAMGLRQIWVALGVPDADDGRRRRSSVWVECTVAMIFGDFLFFSRGFRAFLPVQLSLYPVRLCLYAYASLYVFLVYYYRYVL
jgi:hypothetical protein